jgi:deoxyribose-phosphate aldolase
MTNGEIFAGIDSTQQKAAATRGDIKTLCGEAVRYKAARA